MKLDQRSLLLAAVLLTSGFSAALPKPAPAPAPWPPFLAEWQTIYPNSTTDDVVIAALGQGCAVCHFHPGGGLGWNPYGWEIRQKFFGGLTIHDAILAAEKWDSEPNPKSWSNILEITAGTQPGWTDGPNNIEYQDNFTNTGQLPPAGLTGPFDPASSPMVPLCDPGAAGVANCPCGNPPSGVNRGCDNSDATTGAAVTAAGVASLSADSLVFMTGGERASALSVLLQGPASVPAGAIYGQGVRCVGGTLKRLFVRPASGGSISVPNFGGGDPSISATSAAKGDTIVAGQSRFYLVYYRDPVVLGSCPASSTFNATQTGEVSWQP